MLPPMWNRLLRIRYHEGLSTGRGRVLGIDRHPRPLYTRATAGPPPSCRPALSLWRPFPVAHAVQEDSPWTTYQNVSQPSNTTSRP
jgi:hypothetical protein